MEAEKKQDHEGEGGRSSGLIIDFDYTLVDGIGLLEGMTTGVLTTAGVSLPPGTFARKLFGSKTVSAINALLGQANRTTTEQVVTAIASGMDQVVVVAPVNAALLGIVNQAAAAGVQTLFVTARTQAVVEEKLAALGVVDPCVIKVERCDRFGEYAHDAWQRAARAMHVPPRQCTVIAATAMSIRQAVMAGMRTVAIINPIVSFQDFTGADVIVEGADGVDAMRDPVFACMDLRG